MNLKYSYWYYQSAIPDDICDAIIEAGLEQMEADRARWGDKATYGTTGDLSFKDSTEEMLKEDTVPANHLTMAGVAKKGIDTSKVYVRDSNVSWLSHDWLYDIISPYINGANKQADWNWDWDYIETLQFTRYGPDQFYGWHMDSEVEPYKWFDPNETEPAKDEHGNIKYDVRGDPIPPIGAWTNEPSLVGKTRKISMTLNLTDPSAYKGGNLRFDFGPHAPKRFHTCKEIRPKGSIIIFPSHVYHQVTPVTEGTRYSLVAWSCGKPYK